MSINYKVPSHGGAFCACTWHFFYIPESLEARKAALLKTFVCLYRRSRLEINKPIEIQETAPDEPIQREFRFALFIVSHVYMNKLCKNLYFSNLVLKFLFGDLILIVYVCQLLLLFN